MAYSPERSDADSLSEKEKTGEVIQHIEEAVTRTNKGITEEERQWLANIDTKEQDRIYHKVDRRLVPMLALLYLIAHLDRANIGNAKLEYVDTLYCPSRRKMGEI